MQYMLLIYGNEAGAGQRNQGEIGQMWPPMAPIPRR